MGASLLGSTAVPRQEGIWWAGFGAGLFGLFMASTYPLAMSLLPSAGEKRAIDRTLRMCRGKTDPTWRGGDEVVNDTRPI